MASFSAEVDAWVSKTEDRMERVFKTSAQRTALGVKKRTRRKTGFMRASLMASTASMPLIDRNAGPVEGTTYQDDDSQIALVIAGASLGETLYFGFLAPYAVVWEYRDGMIRLEAQNWQRTVREVTTEAKARIR